MDGFVRRNVQAPATAWRDAERLARCAGCTVNDLFVAAAERALSDPDYGKRIVRMCYDMFLPLGRWPADPIDALLVAWILRGDFPVQGRSGRGPQITIRDPDDDPDPDDWWKS